MTGNVTSGSPHTASVPAPRGRSAGRTPGASRPGRRSRGGIDGPQRFAGWLFVTPVVVVLGLFVLLPILMALFVSFTSWNGQGSPFQSSVPIAGGSNYTHLFTLDGLARQDFMTSIRNNIYYVLLTVPLQTVLALALALVLNAKLRGRGFFRTAFFFPSVTSSVAISVVFLFMFANGGAINALLRAAGVHGPAWFSDPRGLIQIILDKLGIVDLDHPPRVLAGSHFLGLSTWDWISGPSVAMCSIITLVVWTTSGTFMLMFLAALQNLPVELDEAAMIDGATRWQRLRRVTLPQLKPTLFLVITLGMIGSWQVFDQIYVMSQGGPAKTTLTPAFLSYRTAFRDFNYGPGAAISFILFAIIVIMTLLQRWLMRDRDRVRKPRQRRWQRGSGAGMTSTTAGPVDDTSRGRRIAGRAAGYAMLIIFALIFIYPFIIQLGNTFKTEPNAAANPLSPVPSPFDTSSFVRIFDGTDFPRWMLNSILVTVVVTLGRVFFDSLAGYALARLRFPGRGLIFATIIAMMAVPGVVLLIPKFLVLKQFGIYDSYSGLILPLIVDAAGVFIMKQMFESIPVQVEEAARIDGAGVFRTYWSVVLPMARPALITLTILSFQSSWNEFPHTLVAVQSPEYFTLPRGLADLVSGSLGAGTQYPLKLGAALLATIPIALIFFAFQRYFVRGANEGSVKG